MGGLIEVSRMEVNQGLGSDKGLYVATNDLHGDIGEEFFIARNPSPEVPGIGFGGF